MGRKSHPGGAESYWRSDLNTARTRLAAIDGLAARVFGLLGHKSDRWFEKIEKWCGNEERRRRQKSCDGQKGNDGFEGGGVCE